MANDENVKTILLVEDEAIISIITAKAVRRFGYNIITVKTGEEAVPIVAEDTSISLILMDIDLGDGIDGTETARRILALRHIPIVFHTAHSEQAMVERVKGITRYGYVIKSSGDFVLNSSIEMAYELFEANRRSEETMDTLKETEERYRVAFFTSPDSVNINAMDGRYVDINEGFTNLTGFTREDVMGLLSFEINIWARPEDRVKLIEGLTKTGSVENLESVFRCKDGSLKTALMSARIIGIKNTPHILSITRDISDRKRFEEEIKNRNTELAVLNEELVSAMEELEATNEEFEAMNEELTATNRELQEKDKLIKSEQQFTDSLLDSLPGIFYLYSYPELRLKRWNRNHEVLLGFGPGEIKDREIMKWHAPEAKEAVLKSIETVMKDGFAIIESPLIKKDGSLIPFLITGIRFEAEGQLYLMGIGIDVTDLKHLERERSKFLSVIERSLNEIYIFDSSTFKFKYVNSGALENLGYTLEEMSRLTPVDIKPEFTLEKFNELVRPLRNKEKEREIFYTVHKRKDGSTYPVEIFMQLIAADGEDVFLAVINDITERKKIEDALSESEERYRTLAQVLPDGVIIHSDGKIVYANEAAHKITHAQYSGQLIGCPVIDFVHPDYRGLAEQRIKDGITKKIIGEPVEEIFKTFDGIDITVNVTAIPFTYSGKPAILTIFSDITGRKRNEEEIKKLLAEKELLLKEVHHRIKNNMNTIKGLLTLQSYSLKEPSAAAVLQDAENRVESMMVLYDKLYRSDDFRELSLKEYLPSLVNEIAANFLINGLVKIEYMIDDFNLDAKTLFPLGIIVNEIITNAMKYAFAGRERGLITISASVKNSRAAIIIEDDGIGIPASIDIKHSSGFGLSLINMLTEQIGGNIRLERDNGTKFILELNV
jgi:PAS domain S-box-containing protein